MGWPVDPRGSGRELGLRGSMEALRVGEIGGVERLGSLLDDEFGTTGVDLLGGQESES